MPDIDPSTPKLPRANAYRIRMTLVSVIIAAAAGMGGVYGIGGLMRNAHAQAQCAPAVDLARKIAPFAKGEVAALTMATAPLQLPDLAFEDSEGKTRKLSEWRGRTVLINLWATWCVPCRKEMPALDKLQETLGGKDFEVVAINIDTRDPEKPKNFLKEGNLTKLAYFHDQKAKVFQELKSAGRALGMPTSVLVDGAGCEIATIAGPAEWASDDAMKLIKAATAK
ncbi:MAG TPA: TlpA family protein disulfide reductase [Afipia sp.]|uniref:thiol:disulfide interchange protein TlpA n=1 Tax=unclassified Afipia TaxID=2642050 RepID=UPI0005504D7E|nr:MULTISPECIES: TlpA disulfide reductase family protein [unclassified Afipia]MAH67856.1 TlpA family protein disulfide reductase [Afipia sp.]OUX63064.1 MAG: redoxin [Afipia sp. TMED4]HAO39666.1 TlpA family protein disulfide reductase [Afipia sp.]HAP09720.1 TlpA family protein disulfide reductase [Afipia sp.]HAQ94887.1 TlpA family protein disulfide reductase [Afipia sp.]|tara:strand:- start:253 stop:927 length:675 start_codon:yes stop_codon:yes gene_type:complete